MQFLNPKTPELEPSAPTAATIGLLGYLCFDGFGCTLSELAPCVCIGTALMANVSACMQQTLPFSDQIQAADAAAELCAGYPIASRSHQVAITAITCGAVTLPIIILRCFARQLITKKIWWDDWLAVLSSLVLATIIGLQIKSSEIGFGRHYWTVNPVYAELIFQIFYAFQLLYVVAQVAAKGSLMAFYYRVFPSAKFRIAAKVVVAFLVIHGTVYLGLLAFQCLPLSSIWDKNVIGKCVNLTATGYSGAACSIVEDIVIMLMPIPELLKLKLSRRKKAALVFMFSLGSFACVTSMVRLRYLIAFANTLDPPWDNVDLVIWSVIELSCALICASLPTLRPLLRKIPEALSSVTPSSHKSSTYEHNFSPRYAPARLSEERQTGRFKALPPLPPDDQPGEANLKAGHFSSKEMEGIELQGLENPRSFQK
ncbi:hypothetical protein S7711_04504 [Stachybotrys chartarum IBT 7711]|uniref:Rhodopsin domain-containing protein n=1 Tax=Stachybotrys chartarum (strain CBS 109288 / IBT 7711) TaxID=1280523 RepID=A0A084BA89_STACB|nr:hypothetical protein S7711_04504 [Stachybotrys chartarum IBT 7711]